MLEYWIFVGLLCITGLLLLWRPRMALLFSLAASGFLFFWGMTIESLLLILLSPVLLLITLILVILLKVCRRQPLIRRHGFRWWVVTGIPLVVLFTFGLIAFWSPWLVLLLGLIVVWAISAAIYGTTNRWWTTLQVFSLLGSAIRQNLPLTVALENAAHGRHDYLGSVFREIHAWLVQGYDLTEALERGYPPCPRHLLGLLKVAHKNQQIPQAFVSIEQDLQAGMRWHHLVQTDPGPYPLVILIIMYFQVMGMFTFVMPQAYAVYTEMMGSSEHWPWPTRLLMSLHAGDLPLMQCIGFILAGLVMAQLIKWLRPHSWATQGWWGPLSDRLRWYLPGLGRIEQTLGLLQVTSALRLGLQGGESIDRVIGNALSLDVNRVLKRRLQRWHAAIVSGMNISKAAMQYHLGRPLAWAFESDLNTGQTPKILSSLEALLRARHRYLSVVFRSVLNPCLTIVLALVVGFVVLAIFLPGVRCIAALSGNIYP